MQSPLLDYMDGEHASLGNFSHVIYNQQESLSHLVPATFGGYKKKWWATVAYEI